MAIDPIDGQMKKWSGPYIDGISIYEAEQYLQANGLGYCMIDGELIAEIPCVGGTFNPDFIGMVDYEISSLN